MKTMPLKPRMSEKAYAVSLAENTYVFEVPKTANKATVTAAVTAQFDVTVEDVRLAIVKGKIKRAYKRRARPIDGKRTDVKKAYVRLKAGDSIAIFEAPEEVKAEKTDDKKTQSQAKATTQPAKQGRLRQALGKAPRQTQNKGGDK